MTRAEHTPDASEPTSGPEAYKAALRDFMARKGRPVREGGGSPMSGWDDYEATAHTERPYGRCYWVVRPGAMLTETSFVEWGGTFGSDTCEMAVDVTSADCACGKYADVTLRFEGTFGDVLLGALGESGTPGIPL